MKGVIAFELTRGSEEFLICRIRIPGAESAAIRNHAIGPISCCIEKADLCQSLIGEKRIGKQHLPFQKRRFRCLEEWMLA